MEEPEDSEEVKKEAKTMVDDLIRAGAQKVTGVHDAMIHSLHQKVRTCAPASRVVPEVSEVPEGRLGSAGSTR